MYLEDKTNEQVVCSIARHIAHQRKVIAVSGVTPSGRKTFQIKNAQWLVLCTHRHAMKRSLLCDRMVEYSVLICILNFTIYLDIKIYSDYHFSVAIVSYIISLTDGI